MKLWQAAAARVGRKALTINGSLGGLMRTWPLTGDEEPPVDTFEEYADRLFAANPVVYGAEKLRKAVFAQGRFQYRNLRTGNVFGNDTLRQLERPWPGGTTRQLLTRMLIHGDLSGNAYVLKLRDRLHLMRPDWVTILLGSRLEPDEPWLAEDAELIGYMYMPRGGAASRGAGARIYNPNQVAHFVPNLPDPIAHFRGMSWLTPVVREIIGDKAMTEHKLKFFQNAATPNMIVKFDASQTVDQVRAFKELAEEENAGLDNAYKTVYLGGGADATVVGAHLQQLDFAKTVGKAETRILMAAGVHPVIAAASEGMQGSALNAGNYGQIRRLFSDIHLQDLWSEAASVLRIFASPGPAEELIVDGRHIPFLQDDQLDQAKINFESARALTMLWREGAEPQSAIDAITGNDLTLVRYDGRFRSVQLQRLGAAEPNVDQGVEEADEEDA